MKEEGHGIGIVVEEWEIGERTNKGVRRVRASSTKSEVKKSRIPGYF